mmetsp:Transcript_33840/g.95085  ORF Transcript_33840/g.95085 Transcript_33840/m.95085 type:complete len:201 (+) Transcript_33840:2-604(+)
MPGVFDLVLVVPGGQRAGQGVDPHGHGPHPQPLAQRRREVVAVPLEHVVAAALPLDHHLANDLAELFRAAGRAAHRQSLAEAVVRALHGLAPADTCRRDALGHAERPLAAVDHHAAVEGPVALHHRVVPSRHPSLAEVVDGYEHPLDLLAACVRRHLGHPVWQALDAQPLAERVREVVAVPSADVVGAPLPLLRHVFDKL